MGLGPGNGDVSIVDQRVLELSRQAQAHYLAGDGDGLNESILRLYDIKPQASTDVSCRRLFSCYLQCRCLVAELAADEQRWDDWADSCRSSWMLLGEEIERRSEQGHPYAPFYRAKATLLNATADGVWKAHPDYALAVMSLDRLAQRLMQTLRGFWAGHGAGGEGDLDTMDVFNWASLHTCKALLRWQHPRARRLARELRGEFGVLSEDRSSPVYWDGRVFDLFLRGRLTAQLFAECSANRRQAVRRLRGPDYNLAAYDRSTQAERELLLGRKRPHLEVLKCQRTG